MAPTSPALDEMDADVTADLFVDDDRIDIIEEPEPPEYDDEAGVDRLLRAVRYLERQIDRWTKAAEVSIADTVAWRDKRVARARKSIAFIERSLETWMRGHSERTRTVTTSLPHGTLRVRPAKVKLSIVDEEAAVKWALVNGRSGWVRPRPSEIAKTPAGKEITVGPCVVGPEPAPEGYQWCEARVVDDEGTVERVPGIVVLNPVRKAFGYTVAKSAAEDAAPPQEEGTPDE